MGLTIVAALAIGAFTAYAFAFMDPADKVVSAVIAFAGTSLCTAWLIADPIKQRGRWFIVRVRRR